MPKISIIIVNYNTAKLTLQCIKSVINSHPKSTYEIIVIDNGSSDTSVKEFSKLNNIIKLIRNNSNLGFSKANNLGMMTAKGDYILLLNSDTEVKKHAIDNLIVFAERTKEVGVVGAKLLNPDNTTQSSCFNFPTVYQTLKQYWFRHGKPLDKYFPDGSKPRVVDAVVGAAFLITPEARKKVGLLDERYFMFYEDIDYCRQVYKNNLRVYYLPTALIVHYHGASGKKLIENENQWRRLIPSSKIYHGIYKHYFINFIIWSAQKWQKLVS